MVSRHFIFVSNQSYKYKKPTNHLKKSTYCAENK